MTIKERLDQFLANIDAYIQAKNFVGPAFNEEFKLAESMTIETINGLTQEDCFAHAFMLYQYADAIAQELYKHKTIAAWCDDNLNVILGREVSEMSQYTKHEMKVGAVLKENEVARKINEWKTVAQARVDYLQQKEYNVKCKANCLLEKGKRK